MTISFTVWTCSLAYVVSAIRPAFLITRVTLILTPHYSFQSTKLSTVSACAREWPAQSSGYYVRDQCQVHANVILPWPYIPPIRYNEIGYCYLKPEGLAYSSCRTWSPSIPYPALWFWYLVRDVSSAMLFKSTYCFLLCSQYLFL